MRPLTRERAERSSARILRFAGGVFVLVGGGFFTAFSALPLLEWRAAQDWPAAPCTILESQVLTHTGDDGIRYSTEIRYAYTWNETRYESGLYNFFDIASGGLEAGEARVARFPAGETRECYVNPNNPGEAVLDRSFSNVYLIGCFGLIFVLFGLFLFFYCARDIRQQGRGGAAAPAPRAAAIPRGREQPELASDTGAILLSGGKNSILGPAVLLAAALVWNGVILAAMFQNINIEEDGSIQLVSLLFLIPFVFVGLALIGGAGYFLFKLFNPRPDLTLRPGHVALGGSTLLGWSFRGNAGRIRKLSITLLGLEVATYRRGTTTATERSTFVSIALLEATEPREIREGEVALAVPEFAAPTLAGANNKIQWQLRVRGEIARWPDVREEFDFVVSPLPIASPIRLAPEFRLPE
ncbi:MAG: DUF3592 domain-containing protein [Candidatus Hydrogenedentes bacterium]|nr:DUF3592 domain-containing protein [Candidatus Hydrogenedentota bacterium]